MATKKQTQKPRYSVSRHAMCDYMIFDREQNYHFGSYGTQQEAKQKALNLNNTHKAETR